MIRILLVLRALSSLIFHLERRAVLRPTLALVVHPGGRNIRMAQPFLDLSDVGRMGEGVGGGGGAQGMDAQAGDDL